MILAQCLQGYQLVHPPLISELTPNQQYFIALVTNFDLEIKVKLAGGEISEPVDVTLEQERMAMMTHRFRDEYDEMMEKASKRIPIDYDPSNPIF